jgi:hypothetical protein
VWAVQCCPPLLAKGAVVVLIWFHCCSPLLAKGAVVVVGWAQCCAPGLARVAVVSEKRLPSLLFQEEPELLRAGFDSAVLAFWSAVLL